MPRSGVRGFSPQILKRYRKRAGLTQDELADLAGVSRQAIGSWEDNVNVPSVKPLARVASALRIGIADLAPVDDDDLFLADLRVRAALTQSEAAGLLNVSTTLVAETEKGSKPYDSDRASAMGKLYGAAQGTVKACWDRTVEARLTRLHSR